MSINQETDQLMKSSRSAYKDIITKFSTSVDAIAKAITNILEQDLVSQVPKQKFPELVNHYQTCCKITGNDSILAYTDDLAQAIAFNELFSTISNGHAMLDIDIPELRDFLAEIPGPGLAFDDIRSIEASSFTDVLLDKFLKKHDPAKKKKRGVFYTPDAVVNFILRSIDNILTSEFSIPDGIAGQVMLIDPACGTGAFVRNVYRRILDSGVQAGGLDLKDHLLHDVLGRDIMLASIVFCRLQLEKVLANAGISLDGAEATNVLHVNTLVETKPGEQGFFSPNDHLMVIAGNPPYSVSSANKNAFIDASMKEYKIGLNERNIQPLSDDYIKFLRHAQCTIEEQGKGIVAFITNNAYIYKMIHRRIRESLLSTFDRIYIVNLHGNSNIQERTPDGDADGSVFEIRVGTCIAFLVKTGKGLPPAVFYHEIFGKRDAKLEFLAKNSITTIPFEQVNPCAPSFSFIKNSNGNETEYNQFPSLKDIFKYFTIGVKTHRDDFIVEFDRESLEDKMQSLTGESTDDEIKARFNLKDSSLAIKNYRGSLRNEGIKSSLFLSYNYRAFDTRVTYYSPAVITRHRLRVMKHMLRENVALVTTRLLSTDEFCHCFITKTIGDIGILSSRTSESAYFFPLYLYESKNPVSHEMYGEEGERAANIKEKFLEMLASSYPGEAISPELLLSYIYAILHAPWYRLKYAEYLKSDFPRIPMPVEFSRFSGIATLGTELMKYHLMKFELPESHAEESMKVEKFRHDAAAKKVHINANQAISSISEEAWKFKVGNYQILQKWLRGRKNRLLSPDDVRTFLKIAVAIDGTLKIMKLLENEPLMHEMMS